MTPETVVTANYTGADARTVEQSVATPIEQQMTGVDNMNYMYSVSANSGQMVLTVDFDLKHGPEYRPDSGPDAADPGFRLSCPLPSTILGSRCKNLSLLP